MSLVLSAPPLPPVPAAPRWFGVGSSTLPDAAAAGAASAAQAVQGRDAALLVVLAGGAYDLPALLDGVRSQVGPQVQVVGCLSSGTVLPEGEGGQSVAVTALGGSGFQVSVGVAQVAGRRRTAGARAAGCLRRVVAPHRALLLLVDARAYPYEDVVEGARSVAGSVPVVGGIAGDAAGTGRSQQFLGTGDGVEVLTDAVVAVALGSDAPIAVGTGHGWRSSGPPMTVTRSGDGAVWELDGRSGLDVYLARTQGDPERLAEPRAFQAHAASRPLGIAGPDSDSPQHLRAVRGHDAPDRGLVCLADVPEGARAWLMERDPGTSGLGDAVRAASVGLGGRPALGVLAFASALDRDLDRTGTAVPLAGFGGVAQIGATGTAPAVLQLTAVALAVA